MPFVPLETEERPDEASPALQPSRVGQSPEITSSGLAQGFVPLDAADQPSTTTRGFVPLKGTDQDTQNAERSGVLRNLLLNNPVTAIGEAALNLGTMSVAQPLAGLAGLATEAGRLVGLTDRTGADVVHSVGGALTYQPRGELGQAATGVVTYPFEKLAEGGQFAGNKTLELTGSPLAATAVDTTINALPMALAPAISKAKGKGKAAPAVELETVPDGAPQPTTAPHPTAPPVAAEPIRQGFTPLEQVRDVAAPDMPPETVPAQRLVGDTAPDAPVLGKDAAPAPAGPLPAPQRPPVADMQPVLRDGEAPVSAPAITPNVAGAVPEQIPQPKTARYALMEADEIKASHSKELRPTPDYPQNMVRPEWNRSAAEQKLQKIVHEFDPERLVEGADDANGAPIVGRDGVVEVGNTRAIAVQRVYQANGQKAHDYRQALTERAPVLGLDPEAIQTMKSPVLVRIPDEPTPRISNPEGNTIHGQDPHTTPAQRNNSGSEVGARSLENSQGDGFAQAPTSPGGQPRELAQQVRTDAKQREIEPRTDPRTGDTPDLPADGTANAMAPGANYVGFINDAPPKPGAGAGKAGAAEATERPKPIRREDVLIPFMKALNTGIYEGRITKKGVMGFFRTKSEEVRIKRHADLETAAHEIAHLVDKRVPEIRQAWSSGKDWQIHREELRGLSYDKSKIYEGFAEFVRHYMTQPDVALTRAPTFYKWFEDFTQRHAYGPAIEQARKGMTEWFGQEAIDRARSKIGDHRPLSDSLDGRWDAFRQATVDDLHGVYRMEREIKGGKIEPNGPYEAARLSRASFSIADGSLRYGAPVKKLDGSYGWTGKGLEDILRPVSEKLDDALLYFVGRSSRELMAQGREHLFTNGEIDAMLKLRTPEFDKAFKEYQTWNESVLDFAEAHGVINPLARSMWQRMEYMPFHRVGQPDGFRGKPGDWSGVKALTGGTENLRDILGNMTSNAAMLIDKAVKNEARTKIAALAENEGGGKFMTKIPPESRPVKIEKQAVIAAVLKSMGIEKGDPGAAKAAQRLTKLLEDSPAMLEMVQNNMPPAGGNVVAVLKEGKPTWYEVGDPILLRALESIDRQPPPWIVKWLGLPKRIGQTTITLTPDFMIANMARDTIMGAVMSRAGFRPVVDSIKGMRMRLTNDPLYKDFIANGGGLASIYLEESKFKAKLEKFYNRQGIDYRTVLDSPNKLLGFVETLADSFEVSTRMGEYKRAIDSGANPRHAAYLAREVSTDFAMRGDSKALGFMYDTVMFLKPALLSWDRMARGLTHDPNKGAIATKAGMLALMSAGLYLLNKDNTKYQDLPDWDRDANWHFFVGDQHFRYPKIWEIGAMASAAERTAEKIVTEDAQGLGKDFARIITTTFNLNLMPQILAPLYEQGANRNGFTKSPIETPGMENVQPFMRAKPTTSETLKAAGMATSNLPEALQVNPVRAEALLRGYFNTWAMYGLMLSDQAFFADRMPTRRTDQMPVIRRFYSEDPPINTRYETEFYDMLGEAKRLHGTLRELDKLGRSDLADTKEREPLAPQAKPLERAATNLQGINQEMRKVRRDQDLTPDDKRQRLDELTVERNDLLKRAVLDTKASVKATTSDLQAVTTP